jgi:peptide deformylase
LQGFPAAGAAGGRRYPLLIRLGWNATSARMTTETIARLPILVVPHPSLKTRARPVTPADAETVRDLVPKMFATMYDAPGIGLAAPQIGVGLRLAVIDLMPGDKTAPMVLINPAIVATSTETAVREEGCLSLPGQYADVERPAAVTVRYEDESGVKHQVEADGLLAACLQHELDHLDGVLFVDHLSALKRNMMLRRLAKEMRQKRDEAAGR